MEEANKVAEETTLTLLDLDTVSSLSFDDLEEAPGFVIPPAGVYDLLLETAKLEEYTKKAKGDEPASKGHRIAHYYTIEAVEELVDPKEQKPPIASKFSERFQLNEQGLKYWKTKAKQILGDSVDGANLTVANVIKELAAGTYRIKAKVALKVTDGTGENTGKKFTNIQIRVLKRLEQPSLPA
jgi:hypothetical protein